MHRRTWIHHATLVSEGRTFRGGLLIEDEHIEEICVGDDARPSLPPDREVDASGCYVLPGVIDEHVHFREPGMTHKADWTSESRAAVAGGVTTVLDMPNNVPATTSVEALREKRAIAAAKSLVNYGFFLGATSKNWHELAAADRRKVAGVKLFMGSSTGDMLVDDEQALARLFETCRLPIVTHCEHTPTILEAMARCKEREGADPPVRCHSEIRSAQACYASTAMAVRLARRTGARLHVAHVSTERELELFAPDDEQVTAEACVPHLLFTADDYARLGARIKCNPAVKTPADRAALRRALSDGRIRCVATDHAPHTLREKEGGAARAASGMPFVQFSLVSMLELVTQGVLTLPRLVELMCHAPARLFSIERRGFLREGYKADLAIVRPDAPWTLTPNRIVSRCGWSPMEGHTFRWRVERTYCNGFLIYNKGNITAEYFRGQPVAYDR